MTIAIYMSLLTIFSTVTSLVVEAIKKLLDSKEKNYAANIIVLIVALIVGIGGTAAFYVIFDMPFDKTNIICMILLGFSSAVGSMVGYDKVIQAAKQIASHNN